MIFNLRCCVPVSSTNENHQKRIYVNYDIFVICEGLGFIINVISQHTVSLVIYHSDYQPINSEYTAASHTHTQNMKRMNEAKKEEKKNYIQSQQQ